MPLTLHAGEEAEGERMTEAEWVECNHPETLLDFLERTCKPVSERKLRLFACMCCRRIWHLLPDQRCHTAIKLAEDYADKPSLKRKLSPLFQRLSKEVNGVDREPPDLAAVCWAVQGSSKGRFAITDAESVASLATDVLARVAGELARTKRKGSNRAQIDAEREEMKQQCVLLRDIFCAAFCRVTNLSAWQTSTVVALAQAVYDERSLPTGNLEPDRLAVLADALEDSGCDDAGILTHLRSPGPHLRGCWAVDLILGKE